MRSARAQLGRRSFTWCVYIADRHHTCCSGLSSVQRKASPTPTTATMLAAQQCTLAPELLLLLSRLAAAAARRQTAGPLLPLRWLPGAKWRRAGGRLRVSARAQSRGMQVRCKHAVRLLLLLACPHTRIHRRMHSGGPPRTLLFEALQQQLGGRAWLWLVCNAQWHTLGIAPSAPSALPVLCCSTAAGSPGTQPGMAGGASSSHWARAT